MGEPLILGIDSGLTVTKAVVFSLSGEALSVGRCEVEQLKPRPRFVERDMEALWQGTAAAIREALAAPGLATNDIAVVGVTGHGDGLYLLDAEERPIGNGILSLDSRGAEIIEAWRAVGVLDRALGLTGQYPYAAAPAAILAWLKAHRPDDYARIGWVLSCKDWLRFRLTGRIATDITEASVSFTNVRSQDYSEAALRLFGLEAIAAALPEAHGPHEIVGAVSAVAAEATGLAAGTPVATGLHDVTASAVGMGVVHPGQLSIIAGTFSINEVLSAEPKASTDWCCRNGLHRGQWMNMALSPASSANIDWFLKVCCRDAVEAAEREGGSPFDRLEPEIEQAFAGDSQIVYHPFLYGSPHGDDAWAAFLGLQGWHGRGHLLRAIFEGVVFNHRYHVEALKAAFPCARARLSGGSARSPRICQLFSDALGLEIEVVEIEETGALGAALCGAVGVGLFDSLETAVTQTVGATRRFTPSLAEGERLEARYGHYRRSVELLAPSWADLRDG